MLKVKVNAIIRKDNNKILLIKHEEEPFKGKKSLPEGNVKEGETLKQAVARVVKEKTGLDVNPRFMTGVYDNPERDPRNHTIAIAFLCEITGGEEKEKTLWESSPKELALDHEQILKEALRILDPASMLKVIKKE